MPSAIGRNLNLCFTKIRHPQVSESQQSTSLSRDDQQHSILVKNYNSLYDHTLDDCSSSSSASEEPDFATVFASQRFFFSSPGRSNSIIESTPSLATHCWESSDTMLGIKRPNTVNHSNDQSPFDSDENRYGTVRSRNSRGVKDSVAVPTYSPDPYMDFRRSMQEMVEARDLADVNANWEYLHELLLCYLNLNPKSTHKFIIGAFADLLVSLLSSSEKQNGGSRERRIAPGACEITRQCI